MSRYTKLTAISLTVIAAVIIFASQTGYLGKKKPEPAKFVKSEKQKKLGPKALPNANFWEMRAYPHQDIDMNIYLSGLHQANNLKQELLLKNRKANWTLVGPTNVGGRISDAVIDPNNENILWVAAATGGVFKSIDKGQNWQSVFDDQPFITIGAIAVDPQNSNTVYVGTGEASASSMSFYGYGVYKTTDGGLTWQNIGLQNTSYISRIKIDPQNPNVLYVCATGKLYSQDENRGVYKSSDGGANWTKVLYVSPKTAANDIVIDPVNSNIVYASMWERERSLTSRISGGVTSGIFKSTDGGQNWVKLGGGFPSGEQVGRIGLCISKQDPLKLYAAMASYTPQTGSPFGGVYKTVNGGNSWTRCNDGELSDCYSNFGWYFSKIELDPKNDQIVYVLGVSYFRTDNGGSSWTCLGDYSFGPHVDHHAIAISPTANFLLEGNDGGILTSTTSGSEYTEIDLPITQFYGFDVDDNDASRIIGGTQDNGTYLTKTGQPGDWEHVLGGDGFRSLIHPQNSDIMYAESQNGGMTKSIGDYFFDIKDGLIGDDRFDWNTPLIIHPANPQKIFCGSQYLYMSNDAANADYNFLWQPLSDNLCGTTGSIYAIAPAPSDENTIYVGTSNSNLWLTRNGGTNWTKISTTLPNRWITGISVDAHNPAKAVVVYSGLRWDSNLRYVFKTENYGQSWTDITANLPDLPINTVAMDKNNSNLIFVGNDAGVYFTQNGGQSWACAGLGLPNVPVYGIEIHNLSGYVFAATYGKSIYKIPLQSVVGIDETPNLAAANVLISNYPNPFNNSTTINITLPKSAESKLKIYNAAGTLVYTAYEGNLKKGVNKITFDAGKLKLATGLYIATLETPEIKKSYKMNFVK